MYCHGSQKKANACSEAYTNRMKVCINDAVATKAFAHLEHEYVDSEDRKYNEDSKKGQ